MPVVGIAEVLVRPVFNGVQRQIAREMDGAADRAGQSAGASMGRGMRKGMAADVAKVTAGLFGILPAAGAASAGLLAAGGSAITFASSLGSLAGVAGIVPAGLMSITAGAGTLIAAFSGMGEALKTAVDAGNAVSTTNPRLAAMAVEDALQAIADAEENAADAQESAARRVSDAKRSLAETVEDAAEAQIAAAKAVEMAERGEAKAARDVIEAQKDLVKAREDAAKKVNEVGESLEAANRKAVDTARAYQQAMALYNQAKASPGASASDLDELEANAAKAKAVDDAAKRSIVDLRVEHTKAQSAAEASNEKVLDAEQRLADARQAQADAIQDRKDAQADVLKQEKDGAQQIADAQQAVADATKASEKSQKDSARTIADAYRNLERLQLQQADSAAAGGAKAAAAMDKLTPSAQEAALALLAVKDQLGGIRRIAQENFFKGFAAPLLSLAGSVMPQLATGVGAIASALGAGAQTFMGALESSLDGGVLESLLMGVAKSTEILNTAITPIVESFTTLGVVGMPYMARLWQFIADMATNFNNFIQTAAADGSLVAWIDAGIQTLKDLWSIASDIVGVFGSLNKAAEAGGLGSTVSGLAAGMSKLDEIMKGETFQTTMTTIFGGAAAGLEGMKGALDNIAGAFVRGAPAFAEFLRLGGEIAGTFIGGIFDAFSDPTFAAGLQTFMEGLQRGAEAVAPLLPGMFAAVGSFLDAMGPVVEVLGPALVLMFTGLVSGLAGVISFLDPVLVAIAGSPVILGALIAGLVLLTSSWVRMGIAATINGALAVAAWVKMAAAAIVSGAQTAYVWALYALDAIKGAIAFGIQVARVVGGWIAMSAAAVASGIKTAAVWVGTVVASAVSGAIAFGVQVAIIVGGWVLMGVQALLSAGRMALAWLIALGPIGLVIAAVIGLVAIILANWDTISKFTREMWEKHVQPHLEAFGKFMNETLPAAFRTCVQWFQDEWKKIQDAAKEPIRFVIEKVINEGLIDGLNTVGKLLGMGPIDHVPLPAGFADGGYTGPGGKYQPAGIVHAGEIVWSQEDISRWGGVGVVESLRKAAGYAVGGLVHPLRNSVISQAFHGGHNGIDFAAPTGTPIGAAGPGRVSSAGWSAYGGGNEIHIDHPNGLQTWYAHLNSFAVKMGDMVRAGTQIGTVGSTGNSTGPHLHYMVMNGGWPNYVNPAAYLDGGGDPGSAGGGGGLGGWNPIAGIVDGLIASFKAAFPAAGFIADLAIGAGKKLLSGAVEFVTGRGGTDKGIGSTGLPYLHDNGGVLPPGLSQVVNRTRKPEAIYNYEQNRALQALAARGAQQVSGRGGVNFHGPIHVRDEHEMVRLIRTSEQDAQAIYPI